MMMDPTGKDRMTMQIMDKLYFYFAYAYDLGFAFRDDELDEIARAMELQDDNQSTDMALVKLKGILKVKKQKMLQTKNGKRIYEQIADRKIKYCSSSINSIMKQDEEQKVEKESVSVLTPGPLVRRFNGFRDKMQQYLVRIKKSPPCMSSQEMVIFLKEIQRQQAKDGKKHKLRKFEAEHWNVILSAFKSNALSENDYLNMKRKPFSNLMQEKKRPESPKESIMPSGFIVKLDGFLRSELHIIAEQRFTCKKNTVEECTAEEIEGLLLSVLEQ